MTATDSIGPEDRVDGSGETRLRGAALKSLDEKEALDLAPSDPAISLHLDEEEDTLYEDGLELDDDSETLLGTDGNPLP